MKNYIVVADVINLDADNGLTTRIYVSDAYGRIFTTAQSGAHRFASKDTTPVISGFRVVSLVPHGTGSFARD